MSLSLGTRIGPYEITAELGKGGMGEVYRALDTNLGRHVAIKVLPKAFANDAERLARFDREAKTLAANQHTAGRRCCARCPRRVVAVALPFLLRRKCRTRAAHDGRNTPSDDEVRRRIIPASGVITWSSHSK